MDNNPSVKIDIRLRSGQQPPEARNALSLRPRQANMAEEANGVAISLTPVALLTPEDCG
jgi:hypothetical protein